MPIYVKAPSIIKAAGTKPKIIKEVIGRVNTKTADISIAHMQSPCGWQEPGQTPLFDEYTYVLKGQLVVEHKEGKMTVNAGEAIITTKGEWIRYSTPDPLGAEYIAVCLPAFSPDTVCRDT